MFVVGVEFVGKSNFIAPNGRFFPRDVRRITALARQEQNENEQKVSTKQTIELK